MPTKPLNVDFAVDRDARIDDRWINRLTATIEARLRGIETEKANYEAAVGRIETSGLARIAEVLTPALAAVQDLQRTGFLLAYSASSHAPSVGDLLLFEIDPGPEAEYFVPSPLVTLSRTSTPNDWAVARSYGYDAESLLYTCEVVAVSGVFGPVTDWCITAAAGSTQAQQLMLAEGKAARDLTVLRHGDVAEMHSEIEELYAAIQDGPVATVNGQPGPDPVLHSGHILRQGGAATVEAALSDHGTALGALAEAIADRYTKEEVDSGLAGKSDSDHGHLADKITDAGAAGKAVVRAGDLAAVRLAAGLGTMATQAASDYASLDSTGKVPATQLPAAVLGGLNYQGTWNAATNTPAIPAASSANKGHFYKVATAGATAISGINEWKIGDWIVSNGTAWDKVDNTDQVTSVAGRQGAVVLTTGDVSGLGSMATQNANAVAITGGTAGLSTLEVGAAATGGKLSSFGAERTDITGLVGGASAGGLLIEGNVNSHLVLGIRGNDVTDGFHVIRETDANPTGTYHELLFSLTGNVFQYKGAIVYYGGGTDVAVADGGTGASTPGAARANLGAQQAAVDAAALALGFSAAAGVRDIYLYSDGAIADASARIRRTGGITGTFDLNQFGSGAMRFAATGGFQFLSGNVAFGLGTSFGSQVGASATDLSKHIDLYGGVYGFSVTSNSLNVVAPATASLNLSGIANGLKYNGASVHYVGGTNVAVADGGTGASTAAGAVANLGLTTFGAVGTVTFAKDSTLAAKPAYGTYTTAGSNLVKNHDGTPMGLAGTWLAIGGNAAATTSEAIWLRLNL